MTTAFNTSSGLPPTALVVVVPSQGVRMVTRQLTSGCAHWQGTNNYRRQRSNELQSDLVVLTFRSSNDTTYSIPEVVQPMTNDGTWSQFAGTNICPAVCHLADLGGVLGRKHNHQSRFSCKCTGDKLVT